MLVLEGYDKDDPEFVNQEQLLRLIENYKRSLAKYPLTELSRARTTYEFIGKLKRTPISVGPYSELSLFEIANRLYSDLVVLEGAQMIFEAPSLLEVEKVIEVRPLLSNINGFDLIIRTLSGVEINGEAFNVAPSFFKQKVKSTIEKLKKSSNPAYLFFNSDVLNEKSLEKYIQNQVHTHAETIKGYVPCDLKQWDIER